MVIGVEVFPLLADVAPTAERGTAVDFGKGASTREAVGVGSGGCGGIEGSALACGIAVGSGSVGCPGTAREFWQLSSRKSTNRRQ